jgi:sensor histidine kinase regulating citrate/malate metabolism
MENIGLGLYIIKQWVDSINGTFKVEANNNLFEVVIKIPVSIV